MRKIGKIFNGKDAVYAVRYQASCDIAVAEFNKIAQVIKNARLVFNS